MMAVLSINLLWIVFDWIYAYEGVKTLVSQSWPSLYHLYNPIHRNFFFYDLGFVSIYVAEILIRWIVAINRHTYHRWFFYPFVHWYDVLGAVPVGTFRFFRIIRIVSVMYRLQRLQMVDLTRTSLYQLFVKYINIVIEEISDRVLLKILTGVQDQFRQGNPLVTQINSHILQPQRGMLAKWLSERLQQAINTNYSLYKGEIQKYVRQRIKLAIEKNRELSALGSIPVLGKRVNKNIENLVADLVFHVVNDSMEDVAFHRMSRVLDEVTEIILESLLSDHEGTDLDHNLSEVIAQAIEVIKGHVRVQQWKLREEVREEFVQDCEEKEN
jgi:hypothetical protein